MKREKTVDLMPALALKRFKKAPRKRLGLWGTLVASNIVWLCLALKLGGFTWVAIKVEAALTSHYLSERARWAAEHQAQEEELGKLQNEIARMVAFHTGTPADVVELGTRISKVLKSAQNRDQQRFLEKALPSAIHIQVRYSIPASAVIAMSALESRYGQSDLAKDSHNYFGIKAFSEWKGERARNMPTVDSGVKTHADFRAYDSMIDGFQGFADFIAQRSRYAKAFHYTSSGVKFVRELLAAGYCPDSDYLAKIEIIMKRHHLEDLDKIILDGTKTPYQNAWTTASLDVKDSAKDHLDPTR